MTFHGVELCVLCPYIFVVENTRTFLFCFSLVALAKKTHMNDVRVFQLLNRAVVWPHPSSSDTQALRLLWRCGCWLTGNTSRNLRRRVFSHSFYVRDVLAFTTYLENMHIKLRCVYLIVFGWWIILSFRNSTGDQAGPITQFWWPWGQVPFWGGSFSRREWTDVEMFWEIVHLKQKTKWEAYIVELKIVEVNIRKSSTWLGLEMGWRVWEGGVWLLWSAMAYWHWGILRLFNFWQKRDGNLKFSTKCLSPTPWLFSESFIGFHISQTGPWNLFSQTRIV